MEASMPERQVVRLGAAQHMSAMSSLRSVVETLAPDGDAFVIQAPEDWAQGRTLYGGMTAALAYESAKRTHGELGPLRSAQFALIGPATGRLRFVSTLLRRGRSSAMISTECVNDDGAVARAIFVFGAARESKVAHDFLPIPDVPSPDACGPFRKEGPNPARGFWTNFETRLGAGGRIFDVAAPRPEFAIWTRFVDAGDADPMTALLAIADCPPPAAMVHFPQPGPISTMTWAIDILRIPPSIEGWWLLQSSSEHTADGYSMQNMNMWSESGEAIAAGRQTVAIFV
ncbi:MAG: thioesterase family protein [Hyphomonadaceae bacterium]